MNTSKSWYYSSIACDLSINLAAIMFSVCLYFWWLPHSCF